MKLRLSRIHPNFLFILVIVLTAAVLATLQSRVDFLRNADTDVLFRLRWPRPMPSDILLVAIDESDVKALGGWPITRDYYGYLIHILTEKNAKVIGLDVLFDSPGRQYPEYDRMLADFIQSSGRVVLPNVVDFSRPSASSARVNPMPDFARAAAGIGFSNLGDGAIVRRIPLVTGWGDTLLPSFALAVARTALHAEIGRKKGYVLLAAQGRPIIQIPVDGKGRMPLNPWGDITSIRSIRLTALLRQYETAPDSLDFSGKTVLVAATATSLPVLKSVSPGFQVPASVIQAMAVDNILNRTWLQFPPFTVCLFWFIAWMGMARVFSFVQRPRKWMLWFLAGWISIAVLSFCLLVFVRVVMPLFLSVLIFSGTVLHSLWWKKRRQTRVDARWGRIMEAQIEAKEKALAEAEQRLADAEAQLAKETSEKIQLSETGRKLAEEKEAAVLELEKQVRDLKASFEPKGVPGHTRFPEILHDADSPMAGILQMAVKAASDDIPVLIQGETGTGKELIAHAIHQASPRHKKPFIAVNCGALSESLLESELFGHEKGAFTGAMSLRRGRFELAQGGTLFLDEVTETTPAFQAKLLRVLQERTFERVGGEHTLQTDVRIIAAYNTDLVRAVREKRFREDLYFRLKGFPIDLPPLRNRPKDIPVLALFFIQKYASGYSVQVSDAAMEKLKSYRWPGNVRELENAMRRAVLLARSDGREIIQVRDLPEEVRKKSEKAEPALYHSLETQILEMLRAFGFTHSAMGQTAKALGNKDRGTVTEYFRGLCFQYLALNAGDVSKAAAALSGSEDPGVEARVEAKMRDYLENARASLAEKPFLDYTKPSCFKGLPQKFHPFLQRLIDTIL